MTAEWYARATTKRCTTATYNQNFRDAGVSVYLNYTRHTYWDREEQTNYNIMLSHYFNMGSIRNVSISMTGYRYEYDNQAGQRHVHFAQYAVGRQQYR
ncbi:export usher protein [Escherichia coli]|nr:export usher protein [Escherichia coli]